MMMEKFKGIDKHPIILQVGTMYTRYGLLGENTPRKVVITPDEVHDHIVTRFKVKVKPIGLRLRSQRYDRRKTSPMKIL